MNYDYDLVVIGAGSAGLTAVETALGFGKKVALVTKDRLGGECLWFGCVPSKTMLSVAKKVWNSKNSNVNESWKAVKEEIDSATFGIEKDHDNAEYYRKKGVDVFLKPAKFITRNTVEVDGKVISSKYFLICTGSKTKVPNIKGLDKVSYLTNEEIFYLDKLPKSIAVIGGGPIGCELGQALNRLGCKVSLIQHRNELIPGDELYASSFLAETFQNEGINLLLNCNTVEVKQLDKRVELSYEKDGFKATLDVEKILISTGRIPNVNNLGLEKIGIKYSEKGIYHDKTMKTNLSNIYVAGDVAGDLFFTHSAGRQASIAVQNMFLPLIKFKFNYEMVPWVTFTDPEIAHVGYLEKQLIEKKINYRSVEYKYSHLDRAITENNKEGFIKILISNRNRILGAQIVGERAGELIHILELAIKEKLSTLRLIRIIYAYPTYSELIRNALVKDLQENDSWVIRLGKFLAKFR